MSGTQWARLQADLNLRLRRGAWYRITQSGALQTVVEVSGRSVPVPSAFLQIVESPPRRWTVVPRPNDAVRLPASWGDCYAVCPKCRERQAIHGHPSRMQCARCKGKFEMAWNEPYDPAL